MLGEEEGRAEHDCGCEAQVDPPGEVARLLPLNDPEGEGGERERSCGDTDPVDAPACGVRRLRHEEQGHEEGQGADEQVEPEDGPPAPEPHQHATDDRPESERQPGNGRPHPEGVGPGPTVRVDMADDGKRPRLRCGCPQAHEHTCSYEHIDIGRQGSQHGAGTEHADAGQHHFLAPEHVAQRPPGQHECGKGEGIPVDHPLQRGDTGVEAALDVGEADADDGVVQEREEQDYAERGQRRRLLSRAEATFLDLQAGHGSGRRHPHAPRPRIARCLHRPVYPPYADMKRGAHRPDAAIR